MIYDFDIPICVFCFVLFCFISVFSSYLFLYQYPSGYPCPPFKLIILDEADSLTSDAQTALRRTIEQYSRSTRFCLICNYVSRIIDSLTSRCAKFRFGPVEPTAGVDRLASIAAGEAVQFGSSGSKPVLEALMDRCGGDLRRAVTLLQGAHRLGKPLTVEMVDSLAGSVPQSILKAASQILIDKACTAESLRSFVMQIFGRDALPPSQFLHQFISSVLLHPSEGFAAFSASQKALILEFAARADARISDGADEIIQILDFFYSSRKILTLSNPQIYLL